MSVEYGRLQQLEIAMVKVYIEGIGTVTATLIQRYVDGDVRVSYNGRIYIAKEVA